MQKRKKNLIDLKNNLKNKHPFKNIKTLLKVLSFTKDRYLKKQIFDRKLTIRVTSNNIFFSVKNLLKNKIILSGSCGKYRIRISRKRLKHNALRLIMAFCRQAKKTLTNNGLFISLIIPIKLRKKTINFLKILRHFKVKGKNAVLFRPIIIKFNDKKCFNGCRPAKRRRKKRKAPLLIN